jgi:hypothetical protein
MTQQPDDPGAREGITDEDLPEDLRPTDDNPLAQPLEGEDVKSPEELDVLGGKVPEQRDEQESGDTDG